jgi:glycosyltransferase involved in cell wall biosynthesis
MTTVLELVASSRGGGAVHVLELTRLLAHSPFSVTVAMPDDGGHVTQADFADCGVRCLRTDIAGGLAPRAFLELRSLLRQESFDILHCHGARAAFHGRLACASLGSERPRTVYSIHGFAAPHYNLPRRTLLLAMERVLTPVTDAVICVSAAERDAFLAAGFGPPERLHLVRYGIDAAPFREVVVPGTEQRAALRVPVDGRLITTICRLYRPRDFETLLRSFALVLEATPDVHLLIVGDGPYRPRIESLIGELGLATHVTLTGFRRDVAQILAVTDIFVLATDLWEGLPITILEAMASGVPVVASDVGGIREEIVHQQTGIVVPARNTRVLSQSLLELLSDGEKARSMGERGRQRLDEYFTLERMGRETMAVYDRVTAGDRPHG